jgi:hypothetical protein
MNMKRLGMLLTGAGLIVASGAISFAQADNDRETATLLTPSIRATGFHCNAVNASRKTLVITISIINSVTGSDLSSPPFVKSTTAGTEASYDVDTSPMINDGYCVFEVLGTDDPRDIRADLNATLFHANADGTHTFLSRALEAY